MQTKIFRHVYQFHTYSPEYLSSYDLYPWDLRLDTRGFSHQRPGGPSSADDPIGYCAQAHLHERASMTILRSPLREPDRASLRKTAGGLRALWSRQLLKSRRGPVGPLS